jgi:hypothetical protein
MTTNSVSSLVTADFWRDRLRASGIHLGISLVIAALAALLVFGIWYPYPYRELSGGRELFLLVVTVDVILGPLITLAVFNRKKPWSELRMDLAFVGLVQLAALVYGLWTVAVARPVHMVFEIDRYRVVHAVDIEVDALDKTPPGIVALPWTGPTMLSLRPFKNSEESMEATMAALQGAHLGTRPELWQPYEASKADVLKMAKPLAVLKKRFPKESEQIDQLLHSKSTNPQTLLYLPLSGRKAYWTVFIDPQTAAVVATMPLDSF